MKAGRNDPCPCGSGRKYKHCCLGKEVRGTAAAGSADGRSAGNDPPENECTQLVALFNSGQHESAELMARRLLETHPQSGLTWLVLGTSRQAAGKNAIEALTKATVLLPENPDAHFNLAKALKDLGRLDEAATSYRRVLQIRPDFAGAHNNLGNVLRELGQLANAVASYERALQLAPAYAEAHNNLGIALRRAGRTAEAAECYRHALQIKPDYAEARVNLGNALFELDHPEDAIASFLHALQLMPDYAEAHNGLGAAYKKQGKLDAAEASFRRALSLRPDFAEAHANLGYTLYEGRRLDESEASCRAALQIKPDITEALGHLGRILQESGRIEEAEVICRRALAIDPDYMAACSNLGLVLWEMNRLEESATCFRKAVQLTPGNPETRSNHLFALAWTEGGSSREYISEASKWEGAVLSAIERETAQSRVFSRPARTGHRLRVGYVSADFRQHAVGHFIEALLSAHNRRRVETYAFSAHGISDAVTDRLRGNVDHWQSIAHLGDEQARQMIEELKIDVLVDLSGHTAHNRLGIFARRAAPVQVHYLGFFASTGLSEMDFFIGDPVVLPSSEDPYYSERIWRLPRVWVAYPVRTDTPDVHWQPATDGTLRLGSFNNLRKTTPATLRLWAEILRKLPEAKLVLKTWELDLAVNRRHIEEVMQQFDVPPSRLELLGATPDWHSHMSLYNALDIALDPVDGVGGGTTTCDALWMGVPVVSLLGQRMGQRMTASMLDSIGRAEWLAETGPGYCDKVVALAQNVEHRRSIRLAQRDRMAQSALCDAAGLATMLEDAYEQMFDRWRDATISATGHAGRNSHWKAP